MRYEQYMQRCISLAAKGQGNVSPNPLVGCVIVYDNKIIGEGYHQKYGESHAEVNAIHQVKNKDLLKNSTLFVNLEPCCHYGKTPPCADLIIKYNIPKVVIANIDPFAKVNGEGINRLTQNGIEVITGIHEKKAKFLNRRFFTFHIKKRPYIILKWAETEDRFTAKNSQEIGENFWISSDETQSLVHKWRSEEQAILVGKNTLIKDNPSLTTRKYHGKNPIRVIWDNELKLDVQKLNIYNQDGKLFIFNSIKSEEIKNITYIKIDKSDYLKKILEVLYTKGIQSIIIEGGSITHQNFIDQNLWDEARIIKSQKRIKSGIKAAEVKEYSRYGNDNYNTDNITYIYRSKD